MNNLKKKTVMKCNIFLLISVHIDKSNMLTDDDFLKKYFRISYCCLFRHFEWQICIYVSLCTCIFVTVDLVLFQCPPGMKQQVLAFYTKLLGRIRQPLLPHINVHRPVQVLYKFLSKLCFCMTSFSYSAVSNSIFNSSIVKWIKETAWVQYQF